MYLEKGIGGSCGVIVMFIVVNYVGVIVCIVGEIYLWFGVSNVIFGEVFIYIFGCFLGL